MDIIWSDMLMYVSSVMFRWIIAQVFKARLVVEFEVLLCCTI